MEKVVLLSSDLKLSDLVCVQYLGREGLRAQKWFQTMFRGTPGGLLSRREGEDRLMKDGVRCASENPISLPLEYLATIIIPLNWKVSVAIKGLEAGLK